MQSILLTEFTERHGKFILDFCFSVNSVRNNLNFGKFKQLQREHRIMGDRQRHLMDEEAVERGRIYFSVCALYLLCLFVFSL
jgi:hypothetical protein